MTAPAERKKSAPRQESATNDSVEGRAVQIHHPRKPVAIFIGNADELRKAATALDALPHGTKRARTFGRAVFREHWRRFTAMFPSESERTAIVGKLIAQQARGMLPARIFASLRDEIIARHPIVEFLRSRGHKLIKSGENLATSACPAGAHTKRGHTPVTIYPGTESWHCHDHNVGGTVIDWLKIEKNVPAIDAMRELAGGSNDSRPRAQAKALAVKAKSQPFDWQASVDAVTEKQLEQLAKLRGYSVDLVDELHVQKLIGIYDGKIAFAVVDHDRQIIGAHVWLREKRQWFFKPDGIHTTPMTFGELHKCDCVHVFESQWDAFAFIDKTGIWDGIIVTRGAANGRLVAGLIKDGATVYLWLQNDLPDLKTGKAPGEEWSKSVCEHTPQSCVIKLVKIPAHDLNDWTRDGASATDLLDAIKNAGTLRAQSGRAPLTIRTIDEILRMTFDPADLILPNGYLSAGDLTSICGIGGIGKSRLTMQFAMCCRAGRDFLGWPTNGRDLRFLFLQTENSCRRLQSDLEKMLSAFKPAEQSHIKAGIFFHTLENDDDGFLALDAENQARVEKAILNTAANVIVCDPLRDFNLDDLNSDKVMGDTLRDILRVTKRGNPKRVPLIVHHAVTGKAGVQKVTGWERASFGRNSKVLLMVARAVINVGQARPDDNAVIIVASGKCNNAPEFKPFAAQIDFDTLLYARDDDFDMQNWQNEITKKGTGAGRTTPTKGTIEDLFNLIPPTGTISQNLLLNTASDESRGEKKIAEKKARQFLAILIENGRAFTWHIKRPRLRPSVEIARQPQPEEKPVQQDLPA